MTSGLASLPARLTWYDVLREINDARPRYDLSTGQPLHAGTSTVTAELAAAAAAPATTARLASYLDLDGTPELRARFAAMLAGHLGRPVTADEVLVVPGAQAALCCVQALMRGAGRRLLFPVGIEFPGAVDRHSPLPPSAGRARWSGDVIDMDPASLDWCGVGAAVISRPHSPTGRIWPLSQLEYLAGEAERRSALLVIDETFALPAMPLQIAPVQLLDGPAVVHIFSFSKVGLASERIGVIAAQPRIIAALRGELRASAIAASYLGQLLAAALLRDPAAASSLGQMYHHRWQVLRDALEPLGGGDGTVIARWQGGPFMWLTWQDGPDDMTVFRALLRRGVAVTPGTVLHAAGETVRGVRIGITAPEGALEHIGMLVRAGMHAARRSSPAA
jgi:octopine/nopaline transport system ATP-binding protein